MKGGDNINILKKKRYDMDMTRIQVAIAAGMARGVYSDLQNEKTRLSEMQARRLQKVFDVPWYVLIDEMRGEAK